LLKTLVLRQNATSQVAEKLDAAGGGSFNPRIKLSESMRALTPGMISAHMPEFFCSLFSRTWWRTLEEPQLIGRPILEP
jgi:hypothetical protein